MVAPPPGSPPKPGRRQLQVVRVPPGAPAADAGNVIPLGTTVAVMREVESWLQPEGTRACRVPLGSAGPAQCSGASDRAAEAFTPDHFLFISRPLDEIFRADPYEVVGLEDSSTMDPLPSVAEAWAYGGWSGILELLERRMMVLATLGYTIGVIVVLSIGLLATLVLVWGSYGSSWINRGGELISAVSPTTGMVHPKAHAPKTPRGEYDHLFEDFESAGT